MSELSESACLTQEGTPLERISIEELQYENEVLDAFGVSTAGEFDTFISSVNKLTDQASSSLITTPTSSVTPFASPSNMMTVTSGPMNGVPAGGTLSPKEISRIKEKIGNALDGLKYKKEEFDCQEFTEHAERAYQELTYTSFSCKLWCENPPLLYRSRKLGPGYIDGYAHSLLDYHEYGKIYFFDAAQLAYGNFVQVKLDLNGDGKVQHMENEKREDAGDVGAQFKKRCPDNSRVECTIWSFPDRKAAYDYFQKQPNTGLRNKIRTPQLRY